MATTDELLVALMKNCMKPADPIGDNGLLNQMLTEPLEQPKQVEMTEQPGGDFQKNDNGG